MGLISTLKELLGIEEREPRGRKDVEVTVERKTDAESERAVKEPVASATTSGETETASAAEAETGASAGDAADEDAVDEAEAEPEAEAEESDEEPDTDAEAETAESDEEPDTDEETDDEPAPKGADEPLTSIKGIGDAYAGRLEGAGIETVGDLAAAEPDEVADEADVPRSRLERWIERAKGGD